MLKLVHQSAVVLSISGFALRGLAGLRGAAWLQGRAARTLPHAIDTVLLASALGLAWSLRLNPLATPWLLAKIVLLLIYIGLGIVTLRAGLPRGVRLLAFAAGLLCVAQIAAMAITKQVAGLLA